MMKTFNCILALLTLSMTSCATNSDHSRGSSDAIESERTAAMNDYTACVRERAEKLDDGNSDVTLIALAVQPDCKDQFSRYVTLSGIGMSSGALAAYTERLEDNQTQLTAGIIQKIRSRQLH